MIRIDAVGPVLPTAADPSLLWCDDFSNPAPLRARYFEHDDARGAFVRAPGEGIAGGDALRCRFGKGQVSAGSLKLLLGRNPVGRGVHPERTFRELFWRVYVRHEPGWEGNPAKLSRATCLAGPDWSQGMIAHVWGGRGDSLCIDPATGIRDGRKVTTRYNDFDRLRWLGLREARTPVFAPAETGRWVCVEAQVRLDTPGRADGLFRLWIDHREEASRTDLVWHGAWSDYGIDAVFLENYWNAGSPKEQTRWWAQFAVATAPIGPVTVPRAPTLTRTGLVPSGPWEVEAALDPDGGRVVWRSGPTDPAVRSLSPTTPFAPNTLHWLRARPAGAAWSPWHCPFRTAQRAV